MPLSPLAALELAVVLPGDGPYQHLIGIPLSLPMGWTHSPPYFCAYTETVTDITNASLNHPALPRHSLEPVLQQFDTTRESNFQQSALLPLGTPSLLPLATVDIYLDDFMALAQPPRHVKTMRTLLHAMDAIFFGTLAHNTRRNIISASKIAKGDGT